MMYYLFLIKKEIIESFHSWKTNIMIVFVIGVFIFISLSSKIILNNPNEDYKYILAMFAGLSVVLQFICFSVLNEKRYQTFEIIKVSNKQLAVLLAKNTTMVLMGIIPVLILYLISVFDNSYIISSIFGWISTVSLLWAGACIGSVVTLYFYDEKIITLISLICTSPLVGILFLCNEYHLTKDSVLLTGLFLLIAVFMTFISWKSYTRTKFYIKM